MFHHSTTLRHNHAAQHLSFKERRLAFGFFGTVKDGFVTGAQKTKAFFSHPFIKTTFFPWAHANTWIWKGRDAIVEALRPVGRYAKKVGLGIVDKENSIGRGLVEPVRGSIESNVRYLIDNVRSVCKGIFQTPLDILKFPIHFFEGGKQAGQKAMTNISETWGSLKEGSFAAVNHCRKAISNTLQIPLQALWRPVRKVLNTPIEIGANISKMLQRKLEGVSGLFKHTREGIQRVLTAQDRVFVESPAPA